MSEQQTAVRTRPYAAVMETAALDGPAIHRLAGPSMRMAAVVIADADLRVMYAEGDVLDRDGCRVQDWPGRPLTEVLPAELLVEFEPRYRAALEGEPQSFECWSDEVSAHWAQISPVLGDDGAVISVVTIIQDITHPDGTDSTERQRGSRSAPDVNDALWLERIRVAIDEDRLVLYGQPIVDLRTGETVQQELLLRMCGEDGAMVDPADFLPVAERCGLISEIDHWVVAQAVHLAALGQPVEFNLSAASINDPDILLTLARAIEQTGADPALLVVEVTETAMMIQPAAGRLFAERVAALGCRLAFDDFGTGYSSLNYLKQSVPAVLRERAGVFYASDTRRLLEYVNRAVKTRPPGELPPAIARGGVSFGRFLDVGTGMTEGLEARMAQATAAAADAARGQARRAFVLEQIAFRDPLTDLWSRRAFDDRYQDLTAAEITPAPTVLMIDVDHFKSVNDGFGHDAGDHALIGVAGCITRSIRPKDFAARYGGDEFAVLLPDTPAQLAAQIGEQIRSLVASELTDPSVTVSIGVSVPDHADRRRATLDVDRALYEAKQHGRNQVAVA